MLNAIRFARRAEDDDVAWRASYFGRHHSFAPFAGYHLLLDEILDRSRALSSNHLAHHSFSPSPANESLSQPTVTEKGVWLARVCAGQIGSLV
jgi:hypothetical protein